MAAYLNDKVLWVLVCPIPTDKDFVLKQENNNKINDSAIQEIEEKISRV